jgi:hypothetical protein
LLFVTDGAILFVLSKRFSTSEQHEHVARVGQDRFINHMRKWRWVYECTQMIEFS